MRKKVLTAMFVMTAVLWAAGCSKAGREETGGLRNQEENSFSETEPETVTITSLNGSKEEILLEVPYDPKRIAVLDMASLDILNCLGAGDRIVGMASTSLDYLQDYAEKEEIAALGTIKEADMEAVMACEPEVILIGGRLASVYDELS